MLSFKTKSASGTDGISGKPLKLTAPYNICDSLTFIYNQIIGTGIFPTSLKMAKVVPIHKTGPYDVLSNYRPISIMSALSKIIERHIHNCLSHYFTSNSLICTHQSAFRPNHSCQTALTNVVESWANACNNSQFSAAVFVDMAKAFDTVNHTLLLTKLQRYKISPQVLQLLTSYISGRAQKVMFQSKTSSCLPLVRGIAQGSILGPLLFNIYVNDLPLHISDSDTSAELFADDLILHLSGPSVNELEAHLNNSLTQLHTWCSNNQMCVNPSKSECMLIASRQKRQRLEDKSLNIKYNGNQITQVSSHKHLGVIIDQNFQWADHIDAINKKLSCSLYQLNQVKHFIDTHTKRIFYFAYIQPHLDFCSNLWGHCAPSHINRLVSLQRRAIKAIVASNNIDDGDFQKLEIMPLDKRTTYNNCILMHKIVHKDAPEYLRNLFPLKNDGYLSHTEKVWVPKPKIDLFKTSFSYRGALDWNQLPLRLRQMQHFPNFKHALAGFI